MRADYQKEDARIKALGQATLANYHRREEIRRRHGGRCNCPACVDEAAKIAATLDEIDDDVRFDDIIDALDEMKTKGSLDSSCPVCGSPPGSMRLVGTLVFFILGMIFCSAVAFGCGIWWTKHLMGGLK